MSRARIAIQYCTPRSNMPKYKPKIGKEFDLEEEQARHQMRLELMAFGIGALIILAFFALLIFDVKIDGVKQIWMSAVLAFGVAAASLGLAGSLSVQFRKSGWLIKGTLGFGVFVLVFLVSVLYRG